MVPCFILYLRRGGFVNTVLPLGNLRPDMEVKNPSVCQKGIFYCPSIGEDKNPPWKPDSLRRSLSATCASPDMHSTVLKSGHFSNGCANHPINGCVLPDTGALISNTESRESSKSSKWEVPSSPSSPSLIPLSLRSSSVLNSGLHPLCFNS